MGVFDCKRRSLLDWLAEGRAGQKPCCQDDSSALHDVDYAPFHGGRRCRGQGTTTAPVQRQANVLETAFYYSSCLSHVLHLTIHLSMLAAR